MAAQYRSLIAELNFLWQHPLSHLIRQAELLPFMRVASAKNITPAKPKTVDPRKTIVDMANARS